MDEAPKVTLTKIVKWLEDLLDADDMPAARRVDAGLILLSYYRREKSAATAGSTAKEEAQARVDAVRQRLCELAWDSDADLEQRLRAVAGAL